MTGTIPVMRVNYTIPQLIKSLFVGGASSHIEKLEEIIRIFFSVKDVKLVSSARSGIYMIVRSLPQRKVIVPSYTCEVVIEAVRLAGKEVVFAPMDKKTLNVSDYPAIDSDTIVIVTHQYGITTEMSQVVEMCRERNAVIIEDCAGSLGGRIGSKLTGTFGDYSVFSFSASKTLHSPTKGGFVIARNRELMDKIQPVPDTKSSLTYKMKQLAKAVGFCLAKNRLLSSLLFGMNHSASAQDENDYLHDESYKRPFYGWQAALVLKQFENIESILMERRKLFSAYSKGICNPLVVCPQSKWGGKNTLSYSC